MVCVELLESGLSLDCDRYLWLMCIVCAGCVYVVSIYWAGLGMVLSALSRV